MNVALQEVVDLPDMAKEIIRQYLVKAFDDMNVVDAAMDDPDACDLPDEEWEILVDNLMRVKVDVKAFL
jgi:hypothetical protein